MLLDQGCIQEKVELAQFESRCKVGLAVVRKVMLVVERHNFLDVAAELDHMVGLG